MKRPAIFALGCAAVSSFAAIVSAQSMQNSNAPKPDVVVLAKDFIPAQSVNVALGGPNNMYGRPSECATLSKRTQFGVVPV
jgi:hypothetical protein